MIAEVIVDVANSEVDKIFDYIAIPDVSIGDRVLVPFGRRTIEGYVINLKDKSDLPKDKLEEGLNKLKEGKPVQYIVGNVDFYDVNLLVNENVLIPRFETETLVEKTINYAKNLKEPLDILDIGTGSGAIAITLAKHLNSNVLATDISKEALKIAEENAKRNNVKITFKIVTLFFYKKLASIKKYQFLVIIFFIKMVEVRRVELLSIIPSKQTSTSLVYFLYSSNSHQ